VAKLLSDKEADVHAKDQWGWTALMWAAKNNDGELVKMLLDRGANVNAKDSDGEPALLYALEGGHGEIAKLLRDRGAEDTLAITAVAGDVEGVQRFIREGAEIDTADTDYYSVYPLLLRVARKGHAPVLNVLLNNGVDVNSQDRHGYTALMESARKGHVEAVKLLLDRGADVNAQNNVGYTALVEAAGSGHLGILKMLLDRGANVNANATGRWAWTALMNAAWKGNSEAVKCLLDKGAELNVQTEDGRTALKIAQEKGYAKIAELLKAHGAQE